MTDKEWRFVWETLIESRAMARVYGERAGYLDPEYLERVSAAIDMVRIAWDKYVRGDVKRLTSTAALTGPLQASSAPTSQF